MAVFIKVECPACGDKESIIKFGQSSNGKQRYRCQNQSCSTATFILDHERNAWRPEIKTKIIDMTLNGSGIRDTARVLGVCPAAVISTIKKKKVLCNL